jgi:hypothetical protein
MGANYSLFELPLWFMHYSEYGFDRRIGGGRMGGMVPFNACSTLD